MSQREKVFTSPSHGIQKAVEQLRPVQQLMFKRFDEILSLQQHMNEQARKLNEPDTDGELSQANAIAHMMMENTVDYCGVKRGYL